ncbi:hypothetical protein DWZ54_06595 [Mitsuokella sp. AF33-22]|nr:hypothetical protein DWZ54_06595 [Mitsuokella sp. AF33-22]
MKIPPVHYDIIIILIVYHSQPKENAGKQLTPAYSQQQVHDIFLARQSFDHLKHRLDVAGPHQ